MMPVCGSDGYSYPNKCTLEVEACISGKNLTVAAMGECGNLLNILMLLLLFLLLHSLFAFHSQPYLGEIHAPEAMSDC